MTDVLTPQQRSFNMSRIRSRDTRPEMIVRSVVHSLGFRYRLHKKDLPGKPDLVLVRHRKIIDVHGCFFHMHNCRYGKVRPVTNAEFWETKRQSNRKRDRRNVGLLKKAGWQVFNCLGMPNQASRFLAEYAHWFPGGKGIGLGR